MDKKGGSYPRGPRHFLFHRATIERGLITKWIVTIRTRLSFRFCELDKLPFVTISHSELEGWMGTLWVLAWNGCFSKQTNLWICCAVNFCMHMSSSISFAIVSGDCGYEAAHLRCIRYDSRYDVYTVHAPTGTRTTVSATDFHCLPCPAGSLNSIIKSKGQRWLIMISWWLISCKML